ncbi:MAG TPA: hypothetical protein VHI55_09410 [Gaiellaceae bacterium]|nr:hypothetical protein [Gaiellaceae bacterium]
MPDGWALSPEPTSASLAESWRRCHDRAGCPAAAIPGYSRTVILVRDYVAFIEPNTYADDRMRPT